MKCESLQGLWAPSPLLHEVRAMLALDKPPSIWTGAADGKIVRWSLDSWSSPPPKEVWPFALLCGHTAAIVGLEACSSNKTEDEAVISVCFDGGLCLWDVVTGRCWRRRQLPPSAGHPTAVASVPLAAKYVCIAYACTAMPPDVATKDPTIEDADVGVCSPRDKKALSKGGVLILDTATLTVLQNIYHGYLGMGQVNTMVVVAQGLEHTVVIADVHGRARAWSKINLDQEQGKNKQGGTFLPACVSQSGMTKAEAVSISPDGHLLLLVYSSGWVVKSIKDGSLIVQESDGDRYTTGGYFLPTKDAEGHYLIVWDVQGAAIMYSLIQLQSTVSVAALCHIPAVKDTGVKVSFGFVDHTLLRFEFSLSDLKSRSLWETQVTFWDPCLKFLDGSKPACKDFKDSDGRTASFGGGGGLWRGWLKVDEAGQLGPTKGKRIPENAAEGARLNKSEDRLLVGIDGVITASMLLSSFSNVPSAVVYGYGSGKIQLVELQPAEYPEEQPELPHRLSWHTGPILCLAVHCGGNEQQVLLSGSMDCCVCIWDLRGSLISVLHQHVAPVRQFFLPPPETTAPWAQCFISVGDDACVALSSLVSLRMERMFPGHVGSIKQAVWDEVRGYLALLCTQVQPGFKDLLYIWDLHSGARERILRGAAAHSMLKHFTGKRRPTAHLHLPSNSTSASSLLLPFDYQQASVHEKASNQHKSGGEAIPVLHAEEIATQKAGSERLSSKIFQALTQTSNTSLSKRKDVHSTSMETKQHAVQGGCPFPGIAAIQFDMSILLAQDSGIFAKESMADVTDGDKSPLNTAEGRLLRMSLSILHLWGVDQELDKSISSELHIFEPKHYYVGAGLIGNKGAMTLILPNKQATFELWKASSEFWSMRALSMVSLAQHLIRVSKPGSLTCSALAAFYSRGVFEELGTCRPSLEIYVCFWQDPIEHVRLAARTLFHCAASKAIPDILQYHHGSPSADLVDWLESVEGQEWASAAGGSYQDARAARIIVGGALAVWYPTLVRSDLANATAPLLLKLVQATSDKHSATAAEILSAGMANTWLPLIHSEIPQLISDVLSLVHCLSLGDGRNSDTASATASIIHDGLTSYLLPSLATTDMQAFLNTVQRAVSGDSSAYLVGLMALVRVISTSSTTIVPFLGQIVSLVLLGLDVGNPVLRTKSLPIAMAAIKEMVRVFPMVAMYPGSNYTAAKLAVGDPVGDIRSLAIHVYDLHSATLMKLLDASGPPGHPALLTKGGSSRCTQGITALSFSKDGEGLVAFSHQGLIIRWWSLGAAWWEKLSRATVPVQCTKLVLVPPSPGFSPKSSNASIMATLANKAAAASAQQEEEEQQQDEESKAVMINVDLSFRLEWKSDRVVALIRGCDEVGLFQL